MMLPIKLKAMSTILLTSEKKQNFFQTLGTSFSHAPNYFPEMFIIMMT